MKQFFFFMLLALLPASALLSQSNTFPTSGNVGIGTTSPATKLDVKGSVIIDEASPRVFLSAASTDQNRYLGIFNSPTAGSAGGLKAGGILIADAYNYADPAKGDLVVKGNIILGRATPVAGYKLAVAGKIITEEIKVKLQSAGWPDYVFQPN